MDALPSLQGLMTYQSISSKSMRSTRASHRNRPDRTACREYGEPELEMIVRSSLRKQQQTTDNIREGLKPSPSLFPNEKLPINTKSGAIAPIGDIMSTQIKYAYKRHNTWVYRRTYPQHLQPLGSSLKQSRKQQMPKQPRPEWQS